MMKILDRYIVFRYLLTFVFCLFLFTLIVVFIDISEKTDDFVKSGLSFKRIMVDYYFGFIPRIDAMLFPLFVFISVIFFTSKMAGRSEIIAVLSSGVSFKRFLLPFFIASLVLGGALWFFNMGLIPNANKKWASFQSQYIDKNFGINENEGSTKMKVYFKLDSNSYVGFRTYDTISKMGTYFSIFEIRGKELKYNLRAQSFAWDTAQKKWRLNSVQEKYIDSMQERLVNHTELFKNYPFKPIDLSKNSYLKDQLTSKELNDFIAKERFRGSENVGSLLVEKYNRDAIPASVIILTMIGAIIASRKVRGGSGLHLAIGVLLSVFYILIGKLTFVFATKGDFSPVLSAWIPNIVFFFVAIYIYVRAPK